MPSADEAGCTFPLAGHDQVTVFGLIFFFVTAGGLLLAFATWTRARFGLAIVGLVRVGLARFSTDVLFGATNLNF